MNELPTNIPKTKSTNILNYLYDEEFITLINRLSSTIKEYYHHYELYISNIKSQAESINEQTLFSKSAINNILMYINQAKPKLSINTNENYIREKVYSISDRMDKVNEIKKSLIYNANNFDMTFNSFFNEARGLFKKMKQARSNKIEEITSSNYDDHIRKSKEKSSSHSPNCKHAMNRTKYYNTNSHTTNNNNISTQLNSSLNSSQRIDSFNTFGSNPSYYTGNMISFSIEDIIKKNENLISEIALINYKYKELNKENEYLRNMIMKLKQDQQNPLVNLSFKDYNNFNGVNQQEAMISHAKSRSLSKKKQYPICNTDDNEIEIEPLKENKNSQDNKRASKKTNNAMDVSCPPNKDAKKIIKHKRAHSIDNNSNANTNSNSKQANPLMSSINSTNTVDNNNSIKSNPFKTFNNNNMSMSMTIPTNTSNSNTSGNSNTNSKVALASLVISFLSQMKQLQENISSHSKDVKEMKKMFEVKKRELTKLSESIINTESMSLTTPLSQSQTLQTSKTSTTPLKLKASSSSSNKANCSNNNNSDIQIIKLESELSQYKATIIELEKALNQQKDLLSIAELNLNNEIAKNATVTESLDSLQSQLKEMNKIAQEQKKTIEELEQSKIDLNNTIQNIRDTSNIEYEALKANSESMQKQNSHLETEANKLLTEKQSLTEEANILKGEIAMLKLALTESNQNMITISKTNEVILIEKDHIIKNMSNNTLELKKEIEALSDDLKSKQETIAVLHSKMQSLETASKDIKQSKLVEDNKELLSLKELIEKYKHDYNESKKENKELMNKIADLKNSYLSFNEEKENLKQKLIELDQEAEGNIREIQKKNMKLQSYKEEYSNRLNEKFKDKPFNEIKYSSEEYINTLALIKLYKGEMKELNKTLEGKIQNASLSNSLPKGNEKSIEDKQEKLMKEIETLREDNERMKNAMLSYQNKESQNNITSSNNNNDKDNNNPNKTLSDINEQNSNFINDELSSVSGIFLEEKNEESDKSKKPSQTNNNNTNTNDNNNNIVNPLQYSTQKQSMSLPNIVHTEQLSIERKHSQSSLHSNDESKYQTTLKAMEENEVLFREQLNTIKTELKSTIEERNHLKKKCEEVALSSSSSVLTKDELFKILRQTFEKLIDLIQVVGKVKDYVMMILKLLNYSDDEVQKIITKRDKKTLFGIFK